MPMSEEIEVRPAGVDELDEIVALWSHYLRSHRKNPAYRLSRDGLERRRELFRRHLEESESEIFVVAREDGGLDGMITCFPEDNYPYFIPPRYARIQTPYVRPDARHRGNLKKLLAAALRWAREGEFTEMRLYTPARDETARTVSEELGFDAIEVVRRKPIDWRSPPDQQVDA